MRRNVMSLVFPLAVLLSPLCHAQPVAEPGYEIATHIVKYSDLNLADSRGIATLYQRIKSAAIEVCEPAVASRIIETRPHQRRCERTAVEQAVREVNEPKLTELHRSATNPMDFAMAH
jgi:UrcA family protein